MTYAEKLKDPRWQKKRLEVFNRDGFKCLLCEDDKTELQVHHISYDYKCEPWEYPLENFKSLCKHCHAIISLFDIPNGREIVSIKKHIPGKDDMYFYALISSSSNNEVVAIFKLKPDINEYEFLTLIDRVENGLITELLNK